MNSPLLSVKAAGVTYGALAALRDVSIAVKRGERRGIIGPNGAGKTTLFNAIAGSSSLTSGRIIFDSADITKAPPHRRAQLGISRTFQITNLFEQLTVEENLLLAIRGSQARKFSMLDSGHANAAEKSLIDELLANNNLASRRNTQAGQMSYGEQRQLELAVALAASPRMLLLDEPAAGLSPAERVTIANIIRALPNDLTIILIEHDMDLALSLVESITCLHHGEVLCEGSPEAVAADERVLEVYLGKPHHA